MSGRARAFPVLSHLAVWVWLGAGLVWTTLAAESVPETVLDLARIELLAPEPPPSVPEPPAEPAAQPAPEPAAQPAPEPAAQPAPEPAAQPAPPPEPEAPRPPAAAEEPRVEPVGDAELAQGEQLLDGRAPFPALSAGYEDFRSFANYARAMTDLGARFVVIRNREIVGSADLESGRLRAPGALGGFSPRARNYTGEPALAALTREARQRYGGGAAIGMLVPRQLDAGLFGGIARALEARGESAGSYREIRGRYEPAADGGARIRIEAAVRKDGTRTPLGLVFDLGQIAHAGGRDRSA